MALYRVVMHRFQSTRKHANSRKKVFLVFVVIAVLLIGINYATSGMVGRVARMPAGVLWGAGGVFGDSVQGVRDFFTSKHALEQERDALRERVRELEVYALNNMILSSENQELRLLRGDDYNPLNPGTLARVLSRGGAFPFGALIVTHDDAAPYRVGARVFGAGNILLGSVSELTSNTATVRLISGYGEETEVLIGTDDRITQATVRGAGHGNMVTEIARDADITLGDPVVLFADETLVLGFVGDITTKPSSAFQTIRIRSPFNLESIRFVRIK